MAGHEATGIVELITNYQIGSQEVITISGLAGFTGKGLSSFGSVDLLSFTANGKHAVALGKSGTWDGVSTLTFTTGYAATSVLDSYAALDATATGDFVYVLTFKIVNPSSPQVDSTPRTR